MEMGKNSLLLINSTIALDNDEVFFNATRISLFRSKNESWLYFYLLAIEKDEL